MNILFLTAIIFAVALVQCGQTAEKADGVIQPCQEVSNITRYTEFVCRHILSEKFKRQDLKSWESGYERSNKVVNKFLSVQYENLKDEKPANWSCMYLFVKKLCGRVPVQSFIDGDEGQVQQICRGGGRRVRGATRSKGNLCISKSNMTVYDVMSRMQKNKCNVTKVNTGNDPVVVACNKVNNQRLPVHYERFNGQRPDNRNCM